MAALLRRAVRERARRRRGTRIAVSPGRLLALSVACQTSVSIVQWGLGALGPQLARSYGLSAAGLGALVSATSVGNAVALVGAGVLVDRHGARVPLIAGGLGTGVLLAVGGSAPGVAALAVCLLLSGVAGSLISVAGTISVFHGFPAAKRGAALGVRQMSVAAGGLVAAFLLPGLAALGGVALALGVCGALTAATAVAFGLASPAGALHDRVEGSRVIDVRAVLRTPGMWRLLTIGFLLVCSLTAVTTFTVPAARDEGFSTAAAAVLFVVVSLAAMAARVVLGRVADRDGGRRRRATLRDTALIAAAGGLIFWAASGQGLAVQIPALAVFAFGALGFNGLVYAISGELVGPRRAGQAVGLASTVLFGGSALGAVPLGLLADAAGYRTLWPAAAVLAAGGALLSLGLPAPAPRLP